MGAGGNITTALDRVVSRAIARAATQSGLSNDFIGTARSGISIALLDAADCVVDREAVVVALDAHAHSAMADSQAA